MPFRPTPPRACVAALALAALACGPDGGPASEPPLQGWRLVGPPGQTLAMSVEAPWTSLTLPTEGRATQLCHPLDIQGHGRARLDWRWSLDAPEATDAVVQLRVSYLEAEGGPVRGPGGQQRLLTLRGQEATATERHTEALLSSPRGSAAAELCLQLRGQPGATLRLGSPVAVPIEPLEGPEPPNLLIVVVDALRADALGVYGAPPGSSPELDRLSGRAQIHETTWTQYTWTGPSFISYMSSRWARSHGWVSSWADRDALRPRPGAELPTLPGVLRDAGYLTVGLNANGYLDWLDAGQLGFDQWSFEGDIPALNAALRDLSHWNDDGRPNFLYLHLMATHHPLCPSPDAQARAGVSIDRGLYRGRDNKCPDGGLLQAASEYSDHGLDADAHLAVYREAYTAAVHDADRHIGLLLQALHEQGLDRNTVVVVTSDHGELLGEHGQNGHGPWVWEPLTRVPLLIAGPGIEPGRRGETVTRLIDLAPTAIDALGLAEHTPASWQGRSLLQPASSPPLAVSERETWIAFTTDGRFKRIEDAGTGALKGQFDLHADPFEGAALQGQEPVELGALQQAAQEWKDQTPVAVPEGEAGGAELEEVLRGLGYVE